MPTYTLVNPIIIGNLRTTVEADNSALAARELYTRMSGYFSKAQNNLIFTIQKGGVSKNQFTSFKVNEVANKDGEITYTIGKYNGNINSEKLNRTIHKINNRIKQNEGNENKDTYDSNMLASDSEDGSQRQRGGKRDKHESDSIEKILEDLDDEEEEFAYKNKKKYKQELLIPYFNIPTIIDPISYYWYANIYDNLSKIIVPSFIPTISPQIVIDLQLARLP